MWNGSDMSVKREHNFQVYLSAANRKQMALSLSEEVCRHIIVLQNAVCEWLEHFMGSSWKANR
jgi:hypothetical protein